MSKVSKTKKCPRCGKRRRVTKFRSVKKRRDGLAGYCIPCERDYQKEWVREKRTVRIDAAGTGDEG